MLIFLGEGPSYFLVLTETQVLPKNTASTTVLWELSFQTPMLYWPQDRKGFCIILILGCYFQGIHLCPSFMSSSFKNYATFLAYHWHLLTASIIFCFFPKLNISLHPAIFLGDCRVYEDDSSCAVSWASLSLSSSDFTSMLMIILWTFLHHCLKVFLLWKFKRQDSILSSQLSCLSSHPIPHSFNTPSPLAMTLIRNMFVIVWKIIPSSKRLGIEWPYDLAISLLGTYSKELKAGIWTNTCASKKQHNLQQPTEKATQVSVNSWMDEQNAAHLYNGIWVSLTKEGNSDACYNIDESLGLGYYVKWNKPNAKGQIQYDFTYTRYLE